MWKLNVCGCLFVIPCFTFNSLKLAAGMHTLSAIGGKLTVKQDNNGS